MNTKLMKAVLTAANILGGLGTFSFSAPASAVPVAITNTPCGSYVTADQTCSQLGIAADIVSTASLSTLIATARVDNKGPYAFTTYASVTYYMELASSTGAFPNDYFFTIPLQVLANGYADVGGTPPINSTGFNNNGASATVKFGSFGWYACAGSLSVPNCPTNFSNTYQVELKPGSSGSGYGSNIFEITISARAQTNSNYPTSYAYAWADPTIQIDPTFLAAHPEYSLSFSSNLPAAVPVPAAAWLFGSGLLGLIGVARRKKASKSALHV